MPRTKISEFSATAASNTDIDSINIAENCPPSGINDAIRELMAQLKDFQTGAVGDSFNGPVGTTTAAAGAFTTLSASSTVSGTGFSTYLASPPAIGGTAAAAGSFTTLSASGAVTLSGGTANGVAYLNGSKVLTSGSAITFSGQQFAISSLGDQIKISNSVGNQLLTLSSNSAGSVFTSHDGTSFVPILWQSNTAEQMRLTSTGLGIGTTSNRDSNKLDVRGNIAFGSNASYYGQIGYDAGVGSIDLTSSDGAFRFIRQSGSVTSMRLDSSGNLGLGVTPSAWNSTYRAFNIGDSALISSRTGVSINNLELGVNWFRNTSAAFVYKANGFGTNYQQADGGHSWSTAPSGTAGNAITFTQAMTLDASGNLGVGETSPTSRLHVAFTSNSVDATLRVQQKGNNTAAGITLSANDNNGAGYNFIQSETTGGTAHWKISGGVATSTMAFSTGGTERARIDSSGNLLIGTTSVDGVGVSITKTDGTLGRVSLNKSYSGLTDAVPCRYNGTYVGGMQYSNTAVTYLTSSDQRLKKDITNSGSASAKIDQIRIVSHGWKHDDEVVEFGVIAQELYSVAPQAVTVGDDGEEIEKTWGVDYSKLVPLLIKAHQEQQAIIESLTQRIVTLEAK